MTEIAAEMLFQVQQIRHCLGGMIDVALKIDDGGALGQHAMPDAFIQRCPHFQPGLFDGIQNDPSKLLLLTHPDGIALDETITRVLKNQREHDPSDIDSAREIAGFTDVTPVGLFYRNERADRYDEFTVQGLATSREDKLAALESELDRYQI